MPKDLLPGTGCRRGGAGGNSCASMQEASPRATALTPTMPDSRSLDIRQTFCPLARQITNN